MRLKESWQREARSAYLAASVFTRSLPDPAFHQTERIVPEGVDFDCLSASGSYDPVADLRIHPGKLITFFALLQQAVGWIQPDTESSAANIMLDDVDQLRKQKLQRVAVTGCREISFNGMKVPQGGIRRGGANLVAHLLETCSVSIRR